MKRIRFLSGEDTQEASLEIRLVLFELTHFFYYISIPAPKDYEISHICQANNIVFSTCTNLISVEYDD